MLDRMMSSSASAAKDAREMTGYKKGRQSRHGKGHEQPIQLAQQETLESTVRTETDRNPNDGSNTALNANAAVVLGLTTRTLSS